MTQQPEALRLADALKAGYCPVESEREMLDAAAELRRLSAINAQLLEALELLMADECIGGRDGNKARAAIAAAKEQA